MESNFSSFNGWIAQNKVTIADLLLYQLVSWLDGSFGACLNGFMMEGFPADMLNEYPLLQLHKERIEEMPQIKSFRSLHGHPYSSFDFVPEEESPSRPHYCIPATDTTTLPRLTLINMKDSRHADALRFAAAIGKVRARRIWTLVSYQRSTSAHQLSPITTGQPDTLCRQSRRAGQPRMVQCLRATSADMSIPDPGD